MRVLSYVFALLCSSGRAAVLELTTENWNEQVITPDRSAFVKFYAPWCGHCKKLRPDWEKLASETAHLKDKVIVADVDCTSETAKSLCEEHDIKGYPTLKRIHGSMVEDYTGGRSLEELKTYVEGLRPPCSPAHYDACTTEQLEQMKTLEAMDATTRSARVAEIDAVLKKAQDDMDKLVKRLRSEYEAMSSEHDALRKQHEFERSILRALSASEPKKDEL